MTAHAICEDRYNSDYARLVAQLRRDPRGFAVSCVRDLRHKMPMGMDDEVRAMCLDATFTRDGVARLNARLVGLLRARAAASDSNVPRVAVVDAFALTDGRCNLTSDGRHYPAVALAEVRALLGHLAAHRRRASRGADG